MQHRHYNACIQLGKYIYIHQTFRHRLSKNSFHGVIEVHWKYVPSFTQIDPNFH